MNNATDTGPHRFRHSSAMHLSKANVPYHNIKFLLGHYEKTTFRYLRPNWQALRELGEQHLKPNVEQLALVASAEVKV